MAEEIRERLARVRDRIARAAERAGRSAEDITLITVSKTFDADIVQQAVDAGVRDLGENKVQEAANKSLKVQGEGLKWHLIGHLQSNKARLAVTTFDVIHSVDTRQLVERLDRIAGEEGRRPSVLVQVDLGHESTKSGAEEAELPDIIEALDAAKNIDLRGLMTLPPLFDEPERARSYFRRLREILDELNRSRPNGRALGELSMGMSHDFEVAIEEGSTMVRVGTAIFGAREKPAML
jgi:PLP dependent protein